MGVSCIDTSGIYFWVNTFGLQHQPVNVLCLKHVILVAFNSSNNHLYGKSPPFIIIILCPVVTQSPKHLLRMYLIFSRRLPKAMQSQKSQSSPVVFHNNIFSVWPQRLHLLSSYGMLAKKWQLLMLGLSRLRCRVKKHMQPFVTIWENSLLHSACGLLSLYLGSMMLS